ncbi:MAG: phage tail protein [Myxococcota bacterium]|nr:hypothetical protein [Deltaproteobacteria bacterium]MDQ3334844.1 phage tail protein [Myxococcota bacterium]
MNAPAKLTIGSADDTKLNVIAHYNPKEIDLGLQTQWADEMALKGMVPDKKRDKERDIVHDIQYTGSPARSMSLELFLDYYEAPYEGPRESVEAIVHRLQILASPRDEHSDEPHLRRPHMCLVAWGSGKPAFRCVIESLAVKFTMFSSDGTPVRAVCNLKLKEARRRSELRR